ncbi:glycosyltransferase family 4 protein [Psychroserpens sp. SPM9]|uniref:glycosyltransferase family 4 protein n=1 Tax=Psychroserpens sp. SPM9 TaxID=2975598 RepID=UPI0021A73D17|nr:glycosyltransferase family 4 protein [Psychroserpens sp. SPM9]MDG5492225.1 glycosyltransferase family 4 protein [Psychroserpens sp. SPM9]
MKKILYVGNNLQNNTSNTSYINILGGFLSKEGFTLFYTSSYTNKFIRLLDMVKSCLWVSRKVDLVLIDTYSTQNFYYAFIISQLCRILRLDYIPILHGGNLPQRLKSDPKKSRMIFSNAKQNVAPSLYLKAAFEDSGFTNITHIPNAVDLSQYPFRTKVYEIPKLLWVRSFSEIYNPKLAIHVFKALKDIYSEAELCMVGPDSDGTLKAVKQLAKDLNLNVKFTGKLSKSEWINLSKGYNVFINTTNFDNMPVSLIEAMALGFPIVSTNVGGIPFLIQNNENGMLVPPKDSEAMVKAITYVFDNAEQRAQIINNARAQSELLDWNTIKYKWFQILEADNS